MRKLLLISAAAIALAACSPKTDTEAPAPAAQTQEAEKNINARLDAWFEADFQESVRDYPMSMAFLGIPERMDEWNDPSRAFALEQLEKNRQKLAELKANFNPDDLDDSRRLSYRLYVKQAEDQLADDKWHAHSYPFNQMFGAQSGIPTFMLNQHPVKTEEDARNYIARLNGVKDYLGGTVENARRSAEAGILPPLYVYDHVLRDVNNILTGLPFDDSENLNLLMKDF